jgi:hypothetical protein
MYHLLGFLRGTGYEHAARMTDLFNRIIASEAAAS